MKAAAKVQEHNRRVLEDAALRDQIRAGDEAVTPAALSESHWAIELAQLEADAARDAAADEDRAERAAASSALLDTVAPVISASRREVSGALAFLADGVARTAATVEADAHTVAMLVGEVSSTVDPSTTPRYEYSPVGIRIDGQLIKNVRREVAVSVAGLVAHLIRPASSALADELSQLARLGNRFPTTSPTPSKDPV